MASADQVKALLDSFVDGDEQRFFSVAMQVAAHEARLGHSKLAEEIRAAIDGAKRRRGLAQPVPISRPRGELASLVAVSYPAARLSQMILSGELGSQIQRVIREQRNAARILEHGLSPRRKLLLVGPPGTGKTLTAAVLAGELGLPLLQVRLDGLITKFMGETASKLRQVFEATAHTRGVYFFDEFDAIGSHRGVVNDVGEIRRVLNSFLMMLEEDRSHSLIVAATNHEELLDRALYRRFDDVLRYELPDTAQVQRLVRGRVGVSSARKVRWSGLTVKARGLSHAEIVRAVDEVLKERLMDAEKVSVQAALQKALAERQTIQRRLKLNKRATGAHGRRG